jgi:putative flippase GtrA
MAARVNLVATLYKRFRELIHEGAKFCVIGGLGAITTLGGADILHNHLAVGKYSAITISTFVATVVTFLGNRYWTFRHRSGKGTAHESVMFFVLNAVGLLIGYACIFLVQTGFGLGGAIWYDFANFLGLVFGTVFRFWSYRKWVWHVQPVTDVNEAAHSRLEVREPELVPPSPPSSPWMSPTPAPARVVRPAPGQARADHWDGPRHAR